MKVTRVQLIPLPPPLPVEFHIVLTSEESRLLLSALRQTVGLTGCNRVITVLINELNTYAECRG